MATTYDYPTVVRVDLVGLDILLDMDTTLPVTLEDMIHHTQSVKRGANRPLVITNTPFGPCEGSPYEAPKNASA
ncbi:hypothetical protein PRIC1_006839 [Phytophthora ramorum]